MILRILNTKSNFSAYALGKIGDLLPEVPPDIPDVPTPDIPDVPTPDIPTVTIPTNYIEFANVHSRSNLNEEQKYAVAEYLYNLNQAGILGKVRQLYMPCIAPDWAATSLNVARYFNEGVEENTPFGLVSNSTLGQCFQVCDYGIYRTSDQIKWGDCLTTNWKDTDVAMNNMHALMFKPGPSDASIGIGNSGFNLRSRTSASQKFQFSIGSAGSTTQRVRGGWGNGSIHIDGVQTDIKNKIFTEPTGWGNATHDPYCAGISILNNQMITPGSSYDAFLHQNRSLVNEISTWELTGDYELPTTALTGEYAWGGYCGASVSMQQNLACSIVSIGQGLTAEEIQTYMDETDVLMTKLNIKYNNWDPDNLITE